MSIEQTVFEPKPPLGTKEFPSDTLLDPSGEQTVTQRGMEILDGLGVKDLDVDKLVEQAREAASEAGNYVRQNPWPSLAMAIAVGAVVGWLVNRR